MKALEGNIRRDEWITSKTFSKCGRKDENFGGSKIFNCKNCNLSLDRDYNGAKNILLKSLSLKDIVYPIS